MYTAYQLTQECFWEMEILFDADWMNKLLSLCKSKLKVIKCG